MVWVEGQLTEIKVRPDAKTVFMVLRDPAADMSLTVTCPRDLVLNAPVRLAEGTQVIVCGKPTFYTGKGSFSLRLTRDSCSRDRRAAGPHRAAATSSWTPRASSTCG